MLRLFVALWRVGHFERRERCERALGCGLLVELRIEWWG
jgi:hypothetical protein